MPEFSLIERLARAVPTEGEGVELTIGDDAAVLVPTRGKRLAVATDTLNENVHFLPGVSPDALGHKAMAVNLSDLASMGAKPRWALLNLSLPRDDKDWLDGFAAGFARLAMEHHVSLVGGDTCQGPLSVTVTLLGDLPLGGGLRRSGAGEGDRVFVSGTLGSAALALNRRRAGQEVPADLADAMDRPVPRLTLGARLRGLATACIDISDGLLADLGHLAKASGLGAVVDTAALPAGQALLALPEDKRWNLQLCGGDDYELCFTVPETRRDETLALGESLGLPLAEIGRMEAGEGVRCERPGGEAFEPQALAWEHFQRSGLPGD